ncbi:hypothetical protein [Paenibacillus swuensis]
MNRKLLTDADFQEGLDRQRTIRVFQNDHIVSNGGWIVRFTDDLVVIQTDVSDLTYFERDACEFYELRQR